MQKVKIARKFKESVHLLYYWIVLTSMCKPNTLESSQQKKREFKIYKTEQYQKIIYPGHSVTPACSVIPRSLIKFTMKYCTTTPQVKITDRLG